LADVFLSPVIYLESKMASKTENRGFASMDEEKQRQIASKGGKAGGGDHATHEQHVAAGKRSSGGTHEQHVKAGQQSHKNT
jgi:uncharacterized protein